MAELRKHLECLRAKRQLPASLDLWVVSAAMATANNAADREWVFQEAESCSTATGVRTWDEVAVHLKRIIWVGDSRGSLFRSQWQDLFNSLALEELDSLTL